MASEHTHTYDVSDEFLEHVHSCRGEDPNPGVLDRAHRAVLDLPEAVYEHLGADEARDHMRAVASTFNELVPLLGTERWPISPKEVARRAVGNFRAKLRWTMHVYSNGSCKDPRTREPQASFMVKYDGQRWTATLDPTNGQLPSNEGCEVREIVDDSVREVVGQAEGCLQEATDASREGCRRRRQNDEASRDRRPAG